MFEDLVWGAPQWTSVALAVSGLLAALVLWNYAGGTTAAPLRWAAGLLKLIAIALLAVCLLQPLRSGTRPKPQANLFAILVDNSESMSLRPAPRSPTRGERVKERVDPDAAWRVRLAQDFDVRTYAFDARLENSDAIEALPMDGWVSSAATSLEQLATRLKGRPIAGVLLFSDGNLTDAQAAAERDWAEFGFPIYPVLPLANEQIRDLRIADVSVTQSDFETAPVTLRVSVAADGITKDDIVVRVTDTQTGAVVEEQTLKQRRVASGEEVYPEATFRFRPVRSGVRFYQAATFRVADRETWASGTSTSEATFKNNSRLVTVDASRGPYRVLYFGGRPNWEFKYLRRALQADAETELVGLLRIADKEAKFSFRDRDVSSANPLFVGLEDNDEETAQRYDEAVLIRLGVRDADELVRGFPRTAEELFAYDAVILDDIETEFFSQDQLLLLRRFVADRGGGLLLLGGKEAFAGKRFAQSPLGELSPLYSPRGGPVEQAIGSAPEGYKLELTREGMLQPWVRLRENEQAEADRLKRMPAFHSLSPVGEAKPGASVLAFARLPDGRSVPAIAAQRFGNGRSAAIPMGDLWRWSLRRDARPMSSSTRFRSGAAQSDYAAVDPARDDPAQAWRQVTRWLVNEAPRRVECRVVTSEDPNDPARLVTTVRDEAFEPLDNALVELEISLPGGDTYTTVAAADFKNPGQYVTSHWAREPGGYRVVVRAKGEDGSDIGSTEAGWTADPAAAEFRRLATNRQWLEEVAVVSGGEIIDDDRLDAFVASMPSRKVPVTQAWVYPIWHRPWVMLLAILCLCGEWGLRRLKGMP